MLKQIQTINDLKHTYTNIMNILKNIDVELILFYGTLLGFVRNNNFIENDDDIDIIISRKDFNKIMCFLYLNKDASNMTLVSYRIYDNLLQLFWNNIGPFDMYIYDDLEDRILLKHDGNLLYRKSDIFPLKSVVFNNISVSIPANSENILYQTYGEKWMIPQTKNVDYIWENINSVEKLC
jgi:lipopolysaccharide cholinephosphotransferase